MMVIPGDVCAGLLVGWVLPFEGMLPATDWIPVAIAVAACFFTARSVLSYLVVRPMEKPPNAV